MGSIKSLTFITAGLALLLADTSGAQEGAPAKERASFQIDPEVRKAIEAQEKRVFVEAETPLVEWEPAQDADRQKVDARLLAVGDQSVLVAVRLSPEDKAQLLTMWPQVATEAEADHQTILGEELVLRYPVTLDYELTRLEQKLGQVLQFEIGRTLDRRPIVLFVRGT